MDSVAVANQLDAAWQDLVAIGSEDTKGSLPIVDRIVALEDSLRSFLGGCTDAAQIRARYCLQIHMPALINEGFVTDQELASVHGMCRRLVRSRGPFRSVIDHEPITRKELAHQVPIMIRILEIARSSRPVDHASELHGLVVQLKSHLALAPNGAW